METFRTLELIDPLLRALVKEEYTKPTEIQVQAIPPLLAGRDVLGCAQTGTGKTAAFALPILQHLSKHPRAKGKVQIRALVMTPTRELAAQIGDSFAAYGRYLDAKHLVVFGGVNENPQIAALRKGAHILVATPGRLLDLHGRGHVDLSTVDFFVLDEADRMLDMGFVHDVRRVLSHLPAERQNLLFSATMPPAIALLARSFLKDPVKVEVTPQATTVERIDQSVMFVDRPNKRRLLTSLLRSDEVERAIVFTRTKHAANRLSGQLDRAHIRSAAIHGNKSQNARRRALEGFRSGDIPVLIATDIASRGIDVDGVSHVFNYDLPNEPESYVHRIGRTGRAGRAGTAVSFCDTSEGEYLRGIERTIGMAIPVVTEHEFHMPEAIPPVLQGKTSARRSAGDDESTHNRSARGRGRSGRPHQRRAGSKGAKKIQSAMPQRGGEAGQQKETGRPRHKSRTRRRRPRKPE